MAKVAADPPGRGLVDGERGERDRERRRIEKMLFVYGEDIFRGRCPDGGPNKERNAHEIVRRDRRDDQGKYERRDIGRFNIDLRLESICEYLIREPGDGDEDRDRKEQGNRVVGENMERAEDQRDAGQRREDIKHQPIHGYFIQKIIDEGHGFQILLSFTAEDTCYVFRDRDFKSEGV